MDDKLCDTNVTGQVLQDLLAKSAQLQINGHRIVHIEAKVIGEGQGFTSKVLRVFLKWSEQSPELPRSLIVKVIGSTALENVFQNMSKEVVEGFYDQLRRAHNIECAIYDLKSLKDVVKMPICYAKVKSVNKEPGIMVLEDLTDQATVMPVTMWGQGFTPKQLDQLVEALASTHAWSVNHTEWRQVIPSLQEFNVLAPLIDSLTGVFPQSKKAFPEQFKDVDEKDVLENINTKKYVELFGCDPKTRYNLPLILVHGDVHVMNIMFDKKPGTNVADDRLAALIDWQISHQGCAVEDLTRVAIICMSTQGRRENIDNVLRRYIELFNAKVNNKEDHITFEDIKRAYNEMFAFFGIMWVSGVAMFEAFTSKMNLSEKEETELKERMIDYNFANLDDAMKLVKW